MNSKSFYIFRNKKISEFKKINIRDEFEILKTKIFYKFSQNFKKLGVLLDYEDEKQSVEDIENWPLVQSFALDGKI